MPRVFLYVMQSITVAIFTIAIIFVISSFGPSTWHGESLGNILDSVKNIFSYCLFVGVGASSKIDTIFSFTTSFQLTTFAPLSPIMEALYFQFLSMSFHLPVYFYSFDEMIAGIGPVLVQQGNTLATNLYFLIMILLVILACVYLLLFLARSDIKYSLYTVMSIIGLFITALFPGLLRYMLGMINYIIKQYGTNYQIDTTFLNTYFPAMPILNSNTTATFLTGGAFWSAFFIYTCAEFSFQTAYVAKVTQPSIDRERRLKSQISILGEKSLEFEIEKQKEIKEQRIVIESGTKTKEEEKKRVTLKSFFAGGGFGAIREMINRREQERERERLEEISSDTRRLNAYIKRLFEVDKSARESLTAMGSRPNDANMVSSTFLNMGIRLGALLGLTVLVTNPIWLYSAFNIPPVIADSYGITTPEAVLTAIVPIALLFPLLAFIIRTYKRVMLTKFKAQREEQSALLKRISEMQETEEEETPAPDKDQAVSPAETKDA